MHPRSNTKRVITKKSLTGFTLMEVMIVIVIIGLMASAVQFSFSGNDPDKVLNKESQRFSAIFNTAAEYSMLNNIELGLVVEDNTYQFVAFDGETWVSTSGTSFLEPYTLPEEVSIILTLDDLPLDEPPLIEVLHEENEDSDLEFSGSELDKEEKKLIPQVYILSGGDLTPFTLRFQLTDRFDNDSYVSYLVSGLYDTPLTIEGPLFDE